MRIRLRLPTASDLYAEPPLGPLLLLELAAAVASNALRAQHLAIEGDFFSDEGDEVTAARLLARECDTLRNTLHHYRRRVLAHHQS